MAVRHAADHPPDWTVEADGYRLVIENGAMVGLAYDEWPYPWGDERYQNAELIWSAEIVRTTGE